MKTNKETSKIKVFYRKHKIEIFVATGTVVAVSILLLTKNNYELRNRLEVSEDKLDRVHKAVKGGILGGAMGTNKRAIARREGKLNEAISNGNMKAQEMIKRELKELYDERDGYYEVEKILSN